MKREIRIQNNKQNQNKKAFTLVELLLVIALLAVSFGMTSDILVSLVRTQNKTMVENEVEQQANFTSLKIDREIRNAKSVTADGTSLTIERSDNTTVKYAVDANGMMGRFIPATAANPGYLLDTGPGGARVRCGEEDLCFTAEGIPTIVQINLIYYQGQSGGTNPLSTTLRIEIPIKTSTVLRSTY